MDIDTASETCSEVLDAISEAIIAGRTFLEAVLTGVLVRGRALLEDVPGTGKTLTARNVATTLRLSFSRVQFTPDLLPADTTGTNIYDERERIFEFSSGPIFANVVLADGINRAPSETQAALLETMEEGQATVDGGTCQLPGPFFVIATQNPVEQEGTFTLLEAQIDRFVVKSAIGYPDLDGEIELLHRRAGRGDQSPSVECVLNHDIVAAIHRVPESVRVEDGLLEYMAKFTRETRADRRVHIGVPPCGTQRLFEAARAHAVIEGRGFVTPDDVKCVARSVLTHHLILTPDAWVEDVRRSDVVGDMLDRVTVPMLE